MNNIRLTVKIAGLLLVVLTGSFLQAQLNRAFVSGTGNDGNPCTRPSPCKTFPAAVAVLNSGGEIDVLDGGEFGPIPAAKSMTIDGGGGQVAGVVATGVTFSQSDINVTLRNLEINGFGVSAGSGISAPAGFTGLTLHVENCTIGNFTGVGVDFEPGPAPRSRLFMNNVSVRNNTGGGILIGNAIGVLTNVRSDNNGFGIKAVDGARVGVRDSSVGGNLNIGFVAKSTSNSVDLNIADSASTDNNSNGVHAAGPFATVRLSNVTVTGNNGIGLANSGGGQVISFTQGGQGTNNVDQNLGGNGAPTGSTPRE